MVVATLSGVRRPPVLTAAAVTVAPEPPRARAQAPQLCSVVSELSRILAGSPWLAKVDLNPVIVHLRAAGGGATIVDAAIRIG